MAQGLTAELEGFAGFEAAIFQTVSQGRDTPVSGGVLAEGPLDVRCFVLIHDDALDLGAVDAAGGVEVADWCDAGCAASANLLFQAFLGFGG
ncbi:hypothetical protein [Mycolicibacterium mucogenicum]|uniref:hypothetical protein n=1 Tax=Mycolicibacterium mucogenicum TaxID=56689 RepID=UPI0010427A4E|nr:hypothetical protein [Mycolicibacterium mucogenicum]